MLLSIKGLTAGYSGTPVLHDLTLNVDSGEFWGVLGSNGCGKTTLLNCITRNIVPDAGEISFEIGIPHSNRNLHKFIARTGSGGLRPNWLTIREHTLLGRLPWLGWSGLYGPKDHKIARAALTETGLADLSERHVNTLSEGQWQLAAIARALTQILECSPALLLLDEPAANLDFNHKITIFKMLLNLSKKGLAIIAAMHDCSLAASFCSHLFGLHEGKEAFSGPVDEVLTERNLTTLYDYPIGIIRLPDSGQPCVFAHIDDKRSSPGSGPDL